MDTDLCRHKLPKLPVQFVWEHRVWAAAELCLFCAVALSQVPGPLLAAKGDDDAGLTPGAAG